MKKFQIETFLIRKYFNQPRHSAGEVSATRESNNKTRSISRNIDEQRKEIDGKIARETDLKHKYDNVVSDFSKKLEKTEARILGLNEDIVNLGEDEKRLDGEVKMLSEEVINLSNQTKALAGEVKSQTATVMSLKNQYHAMLKQDPDGAPAVRARWESASRALNQKVVEMQNKNAETQKKNDELQAKNNELTRVQTEKKDAENKLEEEKETKAHEEEMIRVNQGNSEAKVFSIQWLNVEKQELGQIKADRIEAQKDVNNEAIEQKKAEISSIDNEKWKTEAEGSVIQEVKEEVSSENYVKSRTEKYLEWLASWDKAIIEAFNSKLTPEENERLHELSGNPTEQLTYLRTVLEKQVKEEQSLAQTAVSQAEQENNEKMDDLNQREKKASNGIQELNQYEKGLARVDSNTDKPSANWVEQKEKLKAPIVQESEWDALADIALNGGVDDSIKTSMEQSEWNSIEKWNEGQPQDASPKVESSQDVQRWSISQSEMNSEKGQNSTPQTTQNESWASQDVQAKQEWQVTYSQDWNVDFNQVWNEGNEEQDAHTPEINPTENNKLNASWDNVGEWSLSAAYRKDMGANTPISLNLPWINNFTPVAQRVHWSFVWGKTFMWPITWEWVKKPSNPSVSLGIPTNSLLKDRMNQVGVISDMESQEGKNRVVATEIMKVFEDPEMIRNTVRGEDADILLAFVAKYVDLKQQDSLSRYRKANEKLTETTYDIGKIDEIIARTLLYDAYDILKKPGHSTKFTDADFQALMDLLDPGSSIVGDQNISQQWNPTEGSQNLPHKRMTLQEFLDPKNSEKVEQLISNAKGISYHQIRSLLSWKAGVDQNSFSIKIFKNKALDAALSTAKVSADTIVANNEFVQKSMPTTIYSQIPRSSWSIYKSENENLSTTQTRKFIDYREVIKSVPREEFNKIFNIQEYKKADGSMMRVANAQISSREEAVKILDSGAAIPMPKLNPDQPEPVLIKKSDSGNGEIVFNYNAKEFKISSDKSFPGYFFTFNNLASNPLFERILRGGQMTSLEYFDKKFRERYPTEKIGDNPNKYYQVLLEEIARASGNSSLLPKDLEDVPNVLKKINNPTFFTPIETDLKKKWLIEESGRITEVSMNISLWYTQQNNTQSSTKSLWVEQKAEISQNSDWAELPEDPLKGI